MQYVDLHNEFVLEKRGKHGAKYLELFQAFRCVSQHCPLPRWWWWYTNTYIYQVSTGLVVLLWLELAMVVRLGLDVSCTDVWCGVCLSSLQTALHLRTGGHEGQELSN